MEKQTVHEHLKQYFGNLGFQEVSERLYDALANESPVADAVVKVIVELKCTNFTRTLTYLTSDSRTLALAALQTLQSTPLLYRSEDIQTIESLIEIIPEAFPPLPTSQVHRVLASTPRKVWKCVCGNLPELGSARCSRCKRDRRGFREGDITPGMAVDALTSQLEALGQLLDVCTEHGGAINEQWAIWDYDDSEGEDVTVPTPS